MEPAAFERWLVEDHFFVMGFRRFLAGLVVIAPHELARGVLSAVLVRWRPSWSCSGGRPTHAG